VHIFRREPLRINGLRGFFSLRAFAEARRGAAVCSGGSGNAVGAQFFVRVAAVFAPGRLAFDVKLADKPQKFYRVRQPQRKFRLPNSR
jgi:hypothetical protein